MNHDDIAYDRLSVGRKAATVSSDQWSGFVRRQWSDHCDASKPKQREDAARFVLDHDIPRLRLASLPGCAWQFEEHLLAERGWLDSDRVVGVEKNASVFAKSSCRIPGFGRLSIESFSLQSGKFESQCRNGRHRLVHAELLSLLSTHRKDFSEPDAYGEFHNSARRWNAVWWDFTSCLCPSVVACLSLTMHNLDLRCRKVPVVVTVAVGRESGVTRNAISEQTGDVYEKRVGVIRESLKANGPRSVAVSGYDVYSSDGGVSILQVRLKCRTNLEYLQSNVWTAAN